MSLVPRTYQARLSEAVEHYWATLRRQARRQKSRGADRGRRAAVTGRKQMDGFAELVAWLLRHNGIPDTDIHTSGSLALPGYFRPTKKWDMLVVSRGALVAALEFKSQRGPSFGNNFNNRAEEAIGVTTDILEAHREGAFAKQHEVPWLGWVMLLEDCERSRAPVALEQPHFPVFANFVGTSYAQRYPLLLRKLKQKKLLDGAAFVLSSEKAGRTGRYSEPASDLTMLKLLTRLAGQVQTFLAES